MVDNDGKLWLNEKYIKQGLDHKNLEMTTTNYFSDHRKNRYEKVDGWIKKQPDKIFMRKELANKVIMECRTTAS